MRAHRPRGRAEAFLCPFILEGLTLLPWLQWHREHLRDDNAPLAAEQYYSCHPCKRRQSARERAGLWCGYLPRSQWIGDGPRLPEGAPESESCPSICPGYSTTLPEVLEAARALGWRQDGLLSEFFGGEPLGARMKLYIDVLLTQVRGVERHAFRVAAKPLKK